MSQPIKSQGGHLVFPISPKNANLVEDIRSCFMSSFVEIRSAFSEKKSKNLKVNDDGRTDDKRRTMRDHNSALEPSDQAHLKPAYSG